MRCWTLAEMFGWRGDDTVHRTWMIGSSSPSVDARGLCIELGLRAVLLLWSSVPSLMASRKLRYTER